MRKEEDEVSKAMRIIAEDQAKKIEACMAEIQIILDKYNLDIVVSSPSISLVPKNQNTK